MKNQFSSIYSKIDKFYKVCKPRIIQPNKVLRVVYIHYPVNGKDGGRKRPDWFDFELCFKNLYHTLSNSTVPFTIDILMDGSPTDNWILNYSNLISLHEFPSCGGGAPLVQRIYEFVESTEWDNDDIVYIIENDYLHLATWPEKLVAAINSFGTDNYYSLYDHPDKYTEGVYVDLKSNILVSEDMNHWRTTPSTCFSFATTKRTLLEDTDIFQIPGILDHLFFTMLGAAKRRKLFTPIPSLSTHCMSKWMAPRIDWQLVGEELR